jgi:isoleucyl-tRNA synthetase
MFKPVNPRVSFPEMEKEILSFWEKEKIFQKSLDKPAPSGTFVFYEGPPTANGKPGLHHVLARAFKDVMPRYKTMRGFNVPRKAGWDTHGLPVEIEVEKKLGINGKQDIEKIKATPEESIIEFNKQCKESVWAYKSDWETMTKRMGFWVDMENPYITYENNYIESVWWVVSQAFQKGLFFKGHKIVPYCPRCGTALSSHELAQGYKEVTDKSIYVKFKAKAEQKIGDWTTDDKTYFLVWTTTPWTLPGNVALAVNSGIKYQVLSIKGENLILASSRTEQVVQEGEKLTEIEGKLLLGIEYEPLYSFVPLEKKAHFVVAGDFVSDSDGTGMVHIAPAYGEDDYSVSKMNDLPVLMTLDKEGKMISEVTPWAGKGAKESDPDIIAELEGRGLLYKTEMYKHDYPFCWRCDTALLYYAKDSWFIEMTKLKTELVKNNENINWVPDNIKHGRFGEWLEGVKDWAISRDRYWGTPLPIWECSSCHKLKSISSVEELKESKDFDEVYKKRLNNNYILARHGEAEQNVSKTLDTLPQKNKSKLTIKGIAQVEKTKDLLESKKIDMVFASPFVRTRETADILAGGKEIVFDDRLVEINGGIFDGKSEAEFDNFFDDKKINRFERTPEEGESWRDIEKRVQSFFNELEEKYADKNILIISHGDPLLLLEKYIEKWDEKKTANTTLINPGSFKEISRNNIDLHRPYIDKITLTCDCGGVMTRAPEVMDVWLDSGTMPYSQLHYPFENREMIDEGKFFPADYICEAVDQTRGWFYTLHAISTFLGFGNSYKNVICLGHILDAKGQKMSKSKGNVVEPMGVGDEHGFDAIRWYMYTNNQPGEPKLFSDEAIKDQVRRFLLILWNTYSFFVTYANLKDFEPSNKASLSDNPKRFDFDRWLLSREHQTIKKVTDSLEKYDIFAASRTIEEFVIDVSTWYVRRNKKRKDPEFLEILYHTLVDIAKLTAPFAPFISEEIYKNLTKKESVHLADWLVANNDLINATLESNMKRVQTIIELSHSIRKEKNLKVRQPLAELQIIENTVGEALESELLDIISDEINVKKVTVVDSFSEGPQWVRKEGFKPDYFISDTPSSLIKVALNIEITPELKAEGNMRDIVRLIQDARKEAKYAFSDAVKCYYQIDSEELKGVFAKFSEEIKKQTILSELTEGETPNKDIEKEGKIGDNTLRIALLK